jgi:hypothetical protein
MPITIPDKNGLRPTTGGTVSESSRYRQCVLAAALVNPAPLRVAATSPSTSGNALVSQAYAAAGRIRYFGYCYQGDLAAGQAPPCIRGMNIEGFAGCTPGEPVYIEDTVPPDPILAFSGLTHTAPAGATNADIIGIAISTSRIAFN